MEALMSGGQQKLEKAMDRFLTVAEEDRKFIQTTITEQVERLDKVAQTQKTTVGRLAETLRQQRGHAGLPTVVLQKYVEGDDPEYFLITLNDCNKQLSGLKRNRLEES
ncbi:hypothetical protein NDU88_004695 [Pleurodeles waltl]|uniref:Uncharacterized protein n=1 Tax=Pleurodeles waltl TaxID=8319 RepID=A0AAV7TSM4_PLEWA|nr:hypothetical protein NDU88_004695 [Pleurodeles waltl]